MKIEIFFLIYSKPRFTMSAQLVPDEILDALHNEHQDNDKVINPPCLYEFHSIKTTSTLFQYSIYASKVFTEGKTYIGNIHILDISDESLLNIREIRAEYKNNWFEIITGSQLFVERHVRKLEGKDMLIFNGIFSNERPFLIDNIPFKIIVQFKTPQLGLKFKLDTVPLPQAGLLTRGTYDNSFPRTIQVYDQFYGTNPIDANTIFVATDRMMTKLNKITLEIDNLHKYTIDAKDIKFTLPDGKFVYIIRFDPTKEFYEGKKSLNFSKIQHGQISTEPSTYLDIWCFGSRKMNNPKDYTLQTIIKK